MSENCSEITPCRSKTGRATRKTGKRSDDPSESEPVIAVKEAPLIQTATLETESHTPLPEVALSSLSPTLTTILDTVTPTTYEPGVSDAILPTIPNTMQKPDNDDLALSGTISNPHCSSGKKISKSADRSRELQRVLKKDEAQLTLYQIQLEHWKPFTDRVKASIEIWGSSATVGEYAVRAKQIAAACQVSGLNDPYATPGQRLAIATALLKGKETYDQAFQQGLDKTEWKDMFRKVVNGSAEFFGLGKKTGNKNRSKK